MTEMSKKGFTSLYILMILSSLIFFMLAAIESTSGYALASRAESACSIAGESVLSEYHSTLWERYGIFALRGQSDWLSSISAYYVEENMASQGHVLLRAERIDCTADSQQYPALDTERFAEQLAKTAVAIAAGECLTAEGKQGAFSELPRTLVRADERQKRMEEQLADIEQALDHSSDEAGMDNAEANMDAAAKRKVRTLISRYRSLQGARPDGGTWEKHINHQCRDLLLPSSLLEIPQRSISISFQGLTNPLSAVEGVYITKKCSFATAVQAGHPLDLEAEYILFGCPSDSENAKRMRNNLFALRSALNMQHIYGDVAKKAEVSKLALSVSAWIPLPLAEFLIASAWSAFEAVTDVEMLLSGESVPFFKQSSDWQTDITGNKILANLTGQENGSSNRSSYYEDYVQAMLFVMPDEHRRARLMDIMQLNIASIPGEVFSFADYAYGFDFEATFEKRIRLPGHVHSSMRKRIVRHSYVYQ